MPGTQFFSRMTYNVSRGLREIVAPRQSMSRKQWEAIKAEFNGQCVYCGEVATKKNRGIVPDHLIPVTRHGELVLGNTVPACQTCNDSRGEKDWRRFLKKKLPAEQAESRIRRIQTHLDQHPYRPVSPTAVFSENELQQYRQLSEDWKALLERARALQAVVKKGKR
jgi:5-methylcytosine-specific restriction endonuclease McrA